jgi:hypothetical protein
MNLAGTPLGLGLGALGSIVGGVGQGAQQADILTQRQRALDIQQRGQELANPDTAPLFKALGIELPSGTGPVPAAVADKLMTTLEARRIQNEQQQAGQQAGQLLRGAATQPTMERVSDPELAKAGLPANATVQTGSTTDPKLLALSHVLGLRLSPSDMGLVQDYLQPKPPTIVPATAQGIIPLGGNYQPLPRPEGYTGNTPPQIPLPAGQQWVPKVDELTGRITWSAQYPPSFNPGQLTHEDATASLISGGKLPQGSRWGTLNDQQNALVAQELTRLQANAAGQKAANVTVNTGLSKLDLPLGAASQQWLNQKGEMPSPSMSQNDAMKAGYMPYKDAVKRLDQEGASRTFLQHVAYLRDKATDLFPESTGNSIGDLAVGQAAAAKRRILGQSDPAVAAILAIDRPAALQMVKAVAPDARAGARLVSMFQEISNPYAPWTKQSYKQAIDSLEQLALTGMAQRGRPGLNPQPPAGATAVPPASDFDRFPAPTGAPNPIQNPAQTKGVVRYGRDANGNIVPLP